MVIDASVAFKWLVEEDDSAIAIGLLGHDSLSAPALILAEVGNALWKRIARGEMNDPGGAAEMLGRLPEMLTLTGDAELAPRAMVLACELDHPIYDCFYLAAAEQQAEVLISADKRFLRKAGNSPHSELVRDLASC